MLDLSLTNMFKRLLTGENVNDSWENIKSCLLNACDKICVWTKGAPWHRETWWWDDTVNNQSNLNVSFGMEKWHKKQRRIPGTKKKSKISCMLCKKFRDLNSTEQHNLIFKMAHKMKVDNKDIIGEKCVKDQEGSMAFDNNSKAKIWQRNYSNLLNVEFWWNHDDLSNEPALHDPPVFTTEGMICKAISQTKKGKATGPSGVALEIILASQQHIPPHLTKLANNIVTEGKIPNDWNLSYIINCFKGNDDPLVTGNYYKLKLLDHIMKIVELVIESIISSSLNINKMQYDFIPVEDTMNAIFFFWQVHKKHCRKHKPLYFAFVNLKKIFNRVARKVICWATQKLGIKERKVKFVQAMYADAASSVCKNSTFSEKFGVKLGVLQGSILSPLLFVIVNCRRGCPWQLFGRFGYNGSILRWITESVLYLERQFWFKKTPG